MKFLIGAIEPNQGYDNSGVNPDATNYVPETSSGNSSTGDTPDPNAPVTPNATPPSDTKKTNWLLYGVLGLIAYALIFNKEK